MTMLSRTVLATALAAKAVTSPVFAQSFDPHVAPFRHAPTGASHSRVPAHRTGHARIINRQTGADAFAMVPDPPRSIDPNGPALTGGGNLGYNRMLLEH